MINQTSSKSHFSCVTLSLLAKVSSVMYQNFLIPSLDDLSTIGCLMGAYNVDIVV